MDGSGQYHIQADNTIMYSIKTGNGRATIASLTSPLSVRSRRGWRSNSRVCDRSIWICYRRIFVQPESITVYAGSER